MKYIHKCNLLRIVLIFTRATCCLLYLCVIDTIHRSGNSKLNFATANFHVTATFQIHYFSFLEWLFCVARTTSFFSTLLSVAFLIRKFLIRRVACFIMLWFWWLAFTFILKKISGTTRYIHSKQKFVCKGLNLYEYTKILFEML